MDTWPSPILSGVHARTLAPTLDTSRILADDSAQAIRGYDVMVACQLPKLNARVRFPLPAPVSSFILLNPAEYVNQAGCLWPVLRPAILLRPCRLSAAEGRRRPYGAWTEVPAPVCGPDAVGRCAVLFQKKGSRRSSATARQAATDISIQ